jgi:hypothetical protein
LINRIYYIYQKKWQHFAISKFLSTVVKPLAPASKAVLGRVKNVPGAGLVECEAAATVVVTSTSGIDKPCICDRFISSPFFVAQAVEVCSLVGVAVPSPSGPEI